VQTPNPESLEVLFADLRAEYLVSLPERLRELCEAVAQGATDLEARRLAQRLAHRMSGTAGTVGLADIGMLGRAMEGFSASCDWSPAARARLLDAVALQERMVREACACEAGGPVPTIQLRAEPVYLALVAGTTR
jgi:HPt (histidine-containing phosphotransfer) domain-containing protein